MKKIYLGHTKLGDEISLDFEKEKVKFILLIGATGSGKSIFHNNLYKQLSENYSTNEIGFVFLDNTMVDFNGWQSDYVVKSVVGKPKEAIEVLVEIAKQEPKKILFVHIEECDIVNVNRAAVEASFEKIKGFKNVYVVYSTSRVDREYLTNWMKIFIDLKVVFCTPTEDDSEFLLSNDTANHFSSAGDRILAFNNQQIVCRPFNDKETKVLESFKF